MNSSTVYKRAETLDEFDQIDRLNHDTFATELGQHAENDSGRLRDPFHPENVYFIAVHDSRVVGMVALHDKPPYSVLKRLAGPAVLDAFPGSKLEIRLLGIHPEHRNQMLFAGLLHMVFEYARAYDWLLISGVEDRIELYRGLGFKELGPPVSDGRAAFVPMIMHVADMPKKIIRDAARWSRRNPRQAAAGS